MNGETATPDHNTVPKAYIELIRQDEAKKRRRPDHPYNPGVVPAMGRLLMTHSRIGPAIDVLQTELMFGSGPLDRSERELLAVVASAAQDCHY
jgi:alkylhydroperoxidase family enzyme